MHRDRSPRPYLLVFQRAFMVGEEKAKVKGKPQLAWKRHPWAAGGCGEP